MNIFDQYLEKIIHLIKLNGENNQIILTENLSSITVDVPPHQFKSDISIRP